MQTTAPYAAAASVSACVGCSSHGQGQRAASVQAASLRLRPASPGSRSASLEHPRRTLGTQSSRRRGSAVVTASAILRPVVANWKQEITWEDVEVADVAKEAEMLYSVTLNIAALPSLQEGYIKAGQFVQVKVGDSKPAFLAIASPPTVASQEKRMEFLIKAVEGSTAELLTKCKAGQLVQVSQVMGKGFNADALSPSSDCAAVLLFATGSGISPIRALIENGFDASSRKDVRLFFGTTDPSFVPYQEKFKAWEDTGVKIIPVYSKPPASWQGETGFVQDALKRSTVPLDGASTGAVLCGYKGMAEDVTAYLKEQGVPAERILLNF